ncbi:EamA family transporter [Tropicibacter sp. S64]|uniref:EamA family transporter n=1 Tax=Tropicibacter sp. S64 TaxID=3415122 RepID=UPI003C7D0F92
MSSQVFLAVVAAALLHASWNALVKGGADKTTSMAAVVLGHMPLAALLLLLVPAPQPQSYPYLAAGVLLHLGYQLFLLQSYKIGDLTQVYPMARGSAPLLVALVSVGFLGVTLNNLEILAILVIGGGILSLALVRRQDGLRNGKAALLALVTGCFIASYSLVDGIGAREAGTSVGFYAWLAIINGIMMAAFLAIRAPHVLRRVAGPGRMPFVVGGTASFVAYALVTWAFTQAPIALVTALRETSIVFALLIGVVFLKERLDLVKLVSTFLTLAGAALLRFARA